MDCHCIADNRNRKLFELNYCLVSTNLGDSLQTQFDHTFIKTCFIKLQYFQKVNIYELFFK